MPDVLRLLIDGLAYSGWEKAEFFRTIEAACGSFTVEVAESPSWTLRPGQGVQVLIDEEPFMLGRIDSVKRSFDKAGKRLTLSGRDLAADLVDCSAVLDAGELRHVALEDLAALLAGPLEVEVVIGTDVDPTERFDLIAITPGETAWETLERALRMRGLLAFSLPTGELMITRPSSAAATDSLIEGRNLKAAELTRDDSERYAAYVITSQRRGSDFDFVQVDAHGNAEDAGGRKPRTLILAAEQHANDDDCQRRAEWEAITRAARSAPAEATAAGWRAAAGGSLWTVNRRVRVKAPSLRLDEERLIASCRYTLSKDDGRETLLGLVRPDAYLPQPTVHPTLFGVGDIAESIAAGQQLNLPGDTAFDEQTDGEFLDDTGG